MRNWDTDRIILLHYLLEGFVILLAFSSYMLLRFPETTRSFFLLYLISGILYWVFLKVKKVVTIGSLAIFSPVAIIIGVFVLNLSIVITIATVSLVAWRILRHFHEVDHHNEIFLFSISLLIGLVEYSFYEELPIGKYFIIILVLQLLLTILIKLNRMYVEMKTQQDPSAKKLARWGMATTGVFFGTGLVLVLFYPYIKTAVFFLFETVVSGLAYVLIQLMIKIFSLFNLDIDPVKLETVIQPPEEDKDHKFKLDGSMHDPTVIYMLVGIILLVIIVIFFFKKIELKSHVNTAFSTNVSVFPENNFNFGTRKRKKYPVPTNEIRKRFYTFENQMVKYDLGRKTYEPVSDWLHRVELTDVNVDDVKRLYEKVRYGELNLTIEEEQHYYNLMDDLTAIAKERAKEVKKRKRSIEKKTRK